MKKITMFSIFLAAFFLGCEKDTSKKEIKPQNGKWVGSYVGSIPQDREDIGFEMNDRELSTIEVSIYFSNLTFYKIFQCNSLLTENSFRYESGQISSIGGKTVIEGNFTSETECNGTVSFEENSATGIGQAHYVFYATPTGHSQPILVPNIASLREGARDGTFIC